MFHEGLSFWSVSGVSGGKSHTLNPMLAKPVSPLFETITEYEHERDYAFVEHVHERRFQLREHAPCASLMCHWVHEHEYTHEYECEHACAPPWDHHHHFTWIIHIWVVYKYKKVIRLVWGPALLVWNVQGLGNVSCSCFWGSGGGGRAAAGKSLAMNPVWVDPVTPF